jgi:hypothetical protein
MNEWIQIIAYTLALYFVLKGVEILQIGLSSSREKRFLVILIGVVSLGISIFAAISFVAISDSIINGS